MRILQVIVGNIILAIGIQLIVWANVGSDSISTLILGLQNFSGLNFGQWAQIISCIFLFITWLMDRSILGIGSVFSALMPGMILSLIEKNLVMPAFIPGNYLISLSGFVIMGVGTAIYLLSDLGSGPIDGIMNGIIGKTRLSLKTARIAIDFTVVLIGFLLGGPIGVGSLFAIFCLGPIIEWSHKFLSKNSRYFASLAK